MRGCRRGLRPARPHDSYETGSVPPVPLTSILSHKGERKLHTCLDRCLTVGTYSVLGVGPAQQRGTIVLTVVPISGLLSTSMLPPRPAA